MTITDRVRFAGRSFALVRVEGPPLFDPLDHGIVVTPARSLCPAGWYGEWSLEPSLTLTALHVRVRDDAVLPRVEGVVAVRRQQRTHRLVSGRWQYGTWPAWDHVYAGLQVERAFTGSLWLGADPVVDAATGGEPLLRYRAVWDIFVEEGRIRAALDRSSDVAGARARTRSAPPERPAFDRLH